VAAVDDLLSTAARIGEQVAAPAADAVDREARFPQNAITALREARLLGALVPPSLGGRGASIVELGAICETLGRHCASTAMIFAMHQTQVACLVRHGQRSPCVRDYLADLARHEWLIASATSEAGVGGDLRQSVCVLEQTGKQLRVTKQAPVISYGEEADDILLTARRASDSPPGDQVLVLLRRADTQLTRTAAWDALGMRGTCSHGFLLTASASCDQVLPAPFADIAYQTMVPISHALWASTWAGIAAGAVNRARAFVRAEARRNASIVPPCALRLAETVADLESLRATVREGIAAFSRIQDDPEALGQLAFALRMNNLKVTAARMAPEVTGRALAVCGISGYRNDSPYAIGRHLRDAHSAALMIANDRLYAANASLLLVCKDE
jgi:acyl-CoA dehydrogenase